jgi:hypothetical protein
MQDIHIGIWKLCVQLHYLPTDAWSIRMKDYEGLLKTMDGQYDKRVYQFELDNLQKLKEYYDGKQ